MAWSAPMTAVANSVFTAAQLPYVISSILTYVI